MEQRKKSIFSRFLAWVASFWDEMDDFHDIRLQKQVKQGILPDLGDKELKVDKQTWEIDFLMSSEGVLETLKADYREKQSETAEIEPDYDPEADLQRFQEKNWNLDGDSEPNGNYIWPADGWNPYMKRVQA